MITATQAAIKIKYDFLKSTSGLLEDLSDLSLSISNIKFWSRYLMMANIRDNELCFYNMFVYFENKYSGQFKFKARYQRETELTEIKQKLTYYFKEFFDFTRIGIEKFNKEFYDFTNDLALATIQKYKSERSEIYQYYNFDEFKTDFPFYIKLNDIELIKDIKTGDFWKK